MRTASFKDKTIWITGASSGIGEALAVSFAENGARLVLSARDAIKTERVATKCRELNPRNEPLVEAFDMADHHGFPRIVERVLRITGSIDILVNNAGVGQRATALSCSPEVVRKIMDVNFFGPVFLTQETLPSMIERRSGRIVVVSSVLGKFHLPGRSAYTASKHALRGYFDTLRTELHGSGIEVTIIYPGWIATPFSRSALTAKGDPYEKSGKAGRRRMSAQECARRMLRAIASGKREVLIGGIETGGGVLKTLFPGLYDWVVGKRSREFVFPAGSAYGGGKPGTDSPPDV